MLKLDSNFLILSRTTKLTAKYLNKSVKVYNGKLYQDIFITQNMIGFKAGFFIQTRSPYFYKKSGKKN
jgi:ribosomal protein S19